MRFLIALTISAAIHAAFIFAPSPQEKVVISGPSDVLHVTIGPKDGEGYTQGEMLLEQQVGVVPLALANSSVTRLLRPCTYPD